MKRVNVNVDQIRVFVTIKNAGTKINAGANVKNSLIKVYVPKALFGILVIVSLKVKNPVMLENIQIIQIISAEKNS